MITFLYMYQSLTNLIFQERYNLALATALSIQVLGTVGLFFEAVLLLLLVLFDEFLLVLLALRDLRLVTVFLDLATVLVVVLAATATLV